MKSGPGWLLVTVAAGWLLAFVWGNGQPAWAGCDPATWRVVVDIGHGPHRPGATSARGVPEYTFNSRLAHRVVAALRAAGFVRAELLDAAGLDLSPTARATRANARRAGILLSIHHDAVQPRYLATWTVGGRARRYCDRFAGYSLFYSGDNRQAGDSLTLARQIGRALRRAGLSFTRHHAEPIAGENRPLVDATVGVYRYDGLAVLRRAAMPAVLIEAGVIVHRGEEQALSGAARQERIASAIARGVREFCRQEDGKSGRGKPF